MTESIINEEKAIQPAAAIAIPERIEVRQILEVQGNYARVSVDARTFKAIQGMNPALPYTTGRNAAGKGIRIFDIGGTTLMTRYDGELKRTNLIMKNDEAEASLHPLYENQQELAFSL